VTPRVRFGVLVALLAGTAALLLTQDASPTAVREAVEAAPAAPVVFVVLYAALTVLLVPGAVGSTAAGALFGAFWGTALTVLGATIGATAAFLIARSLGRAQIERMAGPKIAGVDRWLTDRGVGAVLFLRLVPLFPFSGLTPVPLRTYVAGTAIGILPGTVAFVGLGAGLDDPGSATFLGSLGLLVALSGAGVVALRVTRPRHDGVERAA